MNRSEALVKLFPFSHSNGSRAISPNIEKFCQAGNDVDDFSRLHHGRDHDLILDLGAIHGVQNISNSGFNRYPKSRHSWVCNRNWLIGSQAFNKIGNSGAVGVNYISPPVDCKSSGFLGFIVVEKDFFANCFAVTVNIERI